MADHGDNYIRLVEKDDDGNPVEIGSLGVECGHHCGAIIVGHATQKVAHCICPECHDEFVQVQRASEQRKNPNNPWNTNEPPMTSNGSAPVLDT